MFIWKDRYSLGIKDIDEQHKKLFKIGMNLFELMKNEDKKVSDKYEEIMTLIGQLKDYTIYHFEYEEKKFQNINYDEAEKHMKEHQIFIDKLMDLEDEDINSYQNKITIELIDFIAKWVATHILETDQEYVKYLK